MRVLTPAERRGALWVAALFLLGAAYDGWRSTRVPAPAATTSSEAGAESARQEAVVPPWAGAADGAHALDVSTARQTAPGPEGGAPALIDLNRASAAELEALDGIGPTLARRIVDHRTAHGPFRTVDELLAVRGIGPRLVARIRPQVAAGPPQARPGG